MATDLGTLRLQPRPEFADIVKDRELFGTGQGDTTEDRINSSFDQLLIQSGLGIVPSVFLLLVMLAGLTVAGVLFVWQENLLLSAIGFFLGAIGPIAAVFIARARRQQLLLQQMPEMVGELARAARTGRSVDQCLSVIAMDTPRPLKDELQQVTSRLALGSGLKHALEGMPERTGLMSMKILAMALTVHQQTGGDVTAVLDRLSRTVRERMQYLGRLRAATAASRATAILMLVLPPGILAFFLFRDPTYLSRLFEAPWGRGVTILAVILDVIGVVWTLRILRNSQRT
jgi:tight adherence protein B